MRRKWILMIPVAIAGLVAFTVAGGAVVRTLWNWLMPSLFGWHELTFWQALGLLALCRILFGGISGRGMSRGRWSHHMSPEERERFRQRMRDRCGMRSAPGETPAQ